jgi:hypothetical protein
MVIVYGHRAYGKVEHCGGQFAQTKFAHLYYMPLFPTGSFWVTAQDRSGTRGFPIRMHGKSVMATYLRMWGPIAAIACLVGGNLVATLFGAAFAALSAWAWTLSNTRHRRRSDFNLVAFGSRCEPALMDDDMRDAVKRSIEARWEQVAAGRPPEDIARYGAKTLEEAAAAYGLLRLAALDRAPDADAAADRILAGEIEPLPAGDGPYREADAPETHAAVIAEVESLGAAHHAQTVASRADARRAKGRWWRPNNAVLFVLALAGLGGIIEEAPALGGASAVTANELDTATGFVSVECTKLAYLGDFGSREAGYACMIDGRTLAVVADADRADGPLVGTLKRFTVAGHQWPDDIRYASGAFSVYLTEKSLRGHQVAAVLCILGELAIIGVLIRRRRRKATA